MEIDLAKPEQIKVIDQKRDRQHNKPSSRKERPQDEATCGLAYIPNDPAQRSPLPEEQIANNPVKKNKDSAQHRILLPDIPKVRPSVSLANKKLGWGGQSGLM